MVRLENKRDGICLNMFWMYGSGMIDKDFFIAQIDRIKYDITKTPINDKSLTDTVHFETEDGKYFCNQTTNTFESKKTKIKEQVTCKNCISLISKGLIREKNIIPTKQEVRKVIKDAQGKKEEIKQIRGIDVDVIRKIIDEISDEEDII